MAGSPDSIILKNAEQAAEYLAPLREKGGTLATTNGCFDILHPGHVRYLADAAAQADLLAVGVNCDSIVRRLKGPGRPIQDEMARVSIVGALRAVTCAFVFEEEDPRSFIRTLRPDLHVKGGDYTDGIVEKTTIEEIGGKLVIVPFHGDYSTTGIIERVRADT